MLVLENEMIFWSALCCGDAFVLVGKSKVASELRTKKEDRRSPIHVWYHQGL